jgi:hypothetical protein
MPDARRDIEGMLQSLLGPQREALGRFSVVEPAPDYFFPGLP